MNNFREDWSKLREGKPGRRFEDLYLFRQSHRRGSFSPTRIFNVTVGSILMIGGASIGWLPGPGGFIAIFGLALLAQEFRSVARLLDRIEPRLHRAWGWFRRRWD